MKIARMLIAYLAALAATYVLAVIFYTQQVIAKQAAVGAVYSPAQQLDTYASNFTGLYALALMIAIALAVAFPVAAAVKRIVRPLAVIAYPAAGGAAMLVMLALIEQQLGGGAGVIGGARDALGLSLQCLAGIMGGGVFSIARPR